MAKVFVHGAGISVIREQTMRMGVPPNPCSYWNTECYPLSLQEQLEIAIWLKEKASISEICNFLFARTQIQIHSVVERELQEALTRSSPDREK